MFELQGYMSGRWVTLQDNNNELEIYHNYASAAVTYDKYKDTFERFDIPLRIHRTSV